MRGCNNVCSYCVVPYTRGAERSRDPETIVAEARDVFAKGYREVTLLGQNVDSYHWKCPENSVTFPELLEMVARISPELRVRFATNHPKDISDALIETMARYGNICRHIHLPVQSGSNRLPEKMRRRYTREWFLERVARIREILPDCCITTDVIAGFCSETEEDHQDTLAIFSEARFDYAYMFCYSERPGTLASRHYPDDVPQEVKTRRLNEIIALQNKLSLESNIADIGKTFTVLVEGPSRKSGEELCGRTPGNKMCVWRDTGQKPGEYARIKITSCTSATLLGEAV
jgi:tRNA-2-methylthio-N6-dimethylallyladenosine synthase